MGAVEIRSPKRVVLLILAAGLLGIAPPGSHAQVNVWISRGPEGGYVSKPVIDLQTPGTAYVSAGTVAFKTADAAAHWDMVGTAPGAILAIDPQDSNTVYAGDQSGGGGLRKSTDGGLTWSTPGGVLPCGYSQLIADPKNSGTLFIPCLYSFRSGSEAIYGIFKSTDAGFSWSAASAGLPLFATYAGIDNLLIDPENPQTLYASSMAPLDWGAALYKSTDGGMNWVPAASAEQFPPARGRVRLLAIDPKHPATLYAAGGTASDGVVTGILFQSTDGASNWTPISSFPSVIGGLVIDPQDSAILYAQTDHAVLKSVDGGRTWNAILPFSGWLAAAVSPGGAPSVLYTAKDSSGILKSTDGGATWAPANSGLTATPIRAIAVHPLFPDRLAAAINGFGLATSDTGARSWTETRVTQNIERILFDPQQASNIYASDGFEIYQTTDGGQNLVQLLGRQQPWWDSALVGPQFDSRSPAALYFGSYRSSDGGANWSKLGIDLIALATDPQNPDTLYGAPQTAIDLWQTSVTELRTRLQKSVDGGKTWAPVGREWQAYYISALAADPRDSNVIYAETAGFQCDFMNCPSDYFDPGSDLARQNLGFFKSGDGGDSWTKLDLPDYGVYPAYPRFLGLDSGGTIYLQSGTKLFRSPDRGRTWDEITTEGLKGPLTALAFDPQDLNHLFAGTAHAGVFEIHLAR